MVPQKQQQQQHKSNFLSWYLPILDLMSPERGWQPSHQHGLHSCHLLWARTGSEMSITANSNTRVADIAKGATHIQSTHCHTSGYVYSQHAETASSLCSAPQQCYTLGLPETAFLMTKELHPKHEPWWKTASNLQEGELKRELEQLCRSKVPSCSAGSLWPPFVYCWQASFSTSYLTTRKQCTCI